MKRRYRTQHGGQHWRSGTNWRFNQETSGILRVRGSEVRIHYANFNSRHDVWAVAAAEQPEAQNGRGGRAG